MFLYLLKDEKITYNAENLEMLLVLAFVTRTGWYRGETLKGYYLPSLTLPRLLSGQAVGCSQWVGAGRNAG